ncbi:MAG TPA: hypothetical protein DCW31_09885, partial [Lactobacillus sp.]|nr:hypothetical protein [Lactobacillus sp.]
LNVTNGSGLVNRHFIKYKKNGEEGAYDGYIKNGKRKWFHFWSDYNHIEAGAFYSNYYLGDERDWTDKLSIFHQLSRVSSRSVKSILLALIPILESMEDGVYAVTIRDMLPANGNGSYFYKDEIRHHLMSASTSDIPEYNGYGAILPFSLYAVPTQSEELTNQAFISRDTSVSSKLAVTFGFLGFNDYLFDGHRIAQAAFEQGQSFPCVSILPLFDNLDNNKWNSDLSEFPSDIRYRQSIISAAKFLDYPSVTDILMTYDFFEEFSELSLSEQAQQLSSQLVHGQSESEMLRIIQGLFYGNNRSEYLKLERKIRFDYPFPTIYRRYYGLLVNWLGDDSVEDILMNFLIDRLSDDDELNNFIAAELNRT